MVALGLLLLILAAIVMVTMLARGGDSVRIDLDDLGNFDTDAATVFILGCLTVLVAVLGLAILLAGLKRARRRRSEVRELKDRAQHAETARQRESGGQSPPPDRGDADPHFDSTPRDG